MSRYSYSEFLLILRYLDKINLRISFHNSKGNKYISWKLEQAFKESPEMDLNDDDKNKHPVFMWFNQWEEVNDYEVKGISDHSVLKDTPNWAY